MDDTTGFVGCIHFNATFIVRIELRTMQKNISTKVLLAVNAIFLIIITSGCKKEETVLIPDAQVTPSTHTTTGVDGVIASDRFNVTVKISDTEEKVVIETNDNLHEFVELNQSGGTLTIGFNKDEIDLESITLKATVYTQEINYFEARGWSRISSPDSIVQPTIQLEISDNSNFKAALYVTNLNAKISGKSTVDVKGECSTFELEMAGASFVNGFDLITEILRGNFTWQSSANLTIKQSIYLEASNASNLHYMGRGRIKEQNLQGASYIKHIN